MIIIRLVFALIIVSLMLVSCASLTGTKPSNINSIIDKSFLMKVLIDSRITDENRLVSHLSHTCDLMIGNDRLHVVDLRELVQGVQSPRGFNRILILNDNLIILNSIEYFNHRPLFCRKNNLYIYGDLPIEGIVEEGNVIGFDSTGNVIDIYSINVNDWFES